MIYYGIHTDDGGNMAKIRLGAGDAVTIKQPDATIVAAFGNRFAISLDFEILTDHGPFYQAVLIDRLSFNDYCRVIISTDANSTYHITKITLEHDIVYPPRFGMVQVPAVYRRDSGALHR